jgi:hypothetical protein
MRNPGKFSLNSAFVRLFAGSALELDDVEKAIEGCTTVVISIWPGNISVKRYILNIEPIDKVTG